MTIAFGAIGAKSAGGTTTISVAYPASVGAADLLVAGRCIYNSTGTATDEAGWTAGGNQTGGTGSTAGAHTSRARSDYLVAAGGETGSVTFDQAGTLSGALGQMARYTKDSAKDWDVASASGTDDTHGTNRSITTGTLDMASGDWLVAIVATDAPTDLAGFASPAFSASGITFGTVTRRTTGAGVTTGNDGNVELIDVPITAGSGTVAVTFSFTTTTSQCGPVTLLRLREVTPFAGPAIRTTFSGGAGAAAITSTLTGAQVGDTVLLFDWNNWFTLASRPNPTGTAVSSWGAAVHSLDGGSNDNHCKIYVGTVTTAGGTVITSPSTDEELYHAGVVFVGDVDFDLAASTDVDANATSHVAPAPGTPAGANEVLVCSWCTHNLGLTNYTLPGGMTIVGIERDVVSLMTGVSARENLTSGSAPGTRTATSSASMTYAAASVLIKSVAGGTTHPVNQTDQAGLSDTPELTRSPTHTDSAGLSDATSLQRTPAHTDSAGLTDTAALTRSLSYSDTSGLTDSSTVEPGRAVSQTDSAGLADTTLLQRALVYTDQVGLSDTPTRERGLTQTDQIGLSDTSTVEAGKAVTQTDQVGLSDAATLTRLLNYTDSLGLTDQAPLGRALSHTDSLGLSDNFTAQATKFLTATDSIGLTDTGLELKVENSYSDNAGLSDSSSVQKFGVGAITQTDQAGLSDAAALTQGKGVTDSLGLTDTPGLAWTLNYSDSLGLTDSSSVQKLGAGAIDQTDQAGLTDSTALTQAKTYSDQTGLTDTSGFAGSLTATDNAGLSDSTQIAASGALVQTDQAGLSDTTGLQRGLSHTDSTGLTDTPELTRSPVHSDTTGLTDSSQIQAGRLLTPTDQMGLTDSQLFTQAKAFSDDTGLSDAIAYAQSRTFTDQTGLSDTSSAGLVKPITQTDSTGLTDQRLILRGVEPTDSIGLSDQTVFSITTGLSFTDNAGLTDSIIKGGTVFTPYTGGPWTGGIEHQEHASSNQPRWDSSNQPRWDTDIESAERASNIQPRWATSIRG